MVFFAETFNPGQNVILLDTFLIEFFYSFPNLSENFL